MRKFLRWLHQKTSVIFYKLPFQSKPIKFTCGDLQRLFYVSLPDKETPYYFTADEFYEFVSGQGIDPLTYPLRERVKTRIHVLCNGADVHDMSAQSRKGFFSDVLTEVDVFDNDYIKACIDNIGENASVIDMLGEVMASYCASNDLRCFIKVNMLDYTPTDIVVFDGPDADDVDTEGMPLVIIK